MKRFIKVFLICLVVEWVFLLFGGGLLLENFWGALALLAFIAAMLIQALMGLWERLEAMEKRLTALEQTRNPTKTDQEEIT